MVSLECCIASAKNHVCLFAALPAHPSPRPLPIFPQPPLLSSQQTAWSGIYLEHHRQPAYETPDYCYGWCIVSIHLGAPIVVEKWIEGEPWQRRSVVKGDIGIYPAHMRLRERCLSQTQFIDLYLEPTLFAQAAPELAHSPQQISHCFAQQDPLIFQIGLALKAELEVTGEKLYAESLATALAVHLLRRYSHQSLLPPAPLPHPKLSRALDYIQTHLSDALVLQLEIS